ncbi:glycogen synthase [candidate division KSB1 bacterium]|nr:glycogen synthase [candidate division KSB1 bacterium]
MKKLKILFLSSEVAPFARTSGLADVSISLPQALKELGHEIRIIMPKYKVINDRKYILREVIRLKDIPIKVGESEKKINVKSAFTPDPVKIQTYFIDYKPYFGRDGLYCDIRTKKEYADNDERFILFAKGVLETLKHLFWQPDIIHCNDWQTGLVPFFLKTLYKDDEYFRKTSTVFSVHNVESQGNFLPESFEKTNIEGLEFKEGSDFEYQGKFSFLKTGLSYSGFVTTISEQFAKDVQESKEYGFGFENEFKKISHIFKGIANGVDYAVWDPESDKLLPSNFYPGDLKGKLENKIALAKKFKLQFDEKTPIVSMIAPLAEQQGIDLLEEIFDKLLKTNLQIVILGSGDRKYHALLTKISKQYPDQFGMSFTVSDSSEHLVIAGSDMLLVAPKYGQGFSIQLRALKYGTIPIVMKTGGLADTIKDIDPDTGTGNGFVFEKYESSSLFAAIKNAVSLYEDSKTWKKIMKKGMRQDFSWKIVAKSYLKIYDKVLKK